jgi:hypothetical protein
MIDALFGSKTRVKLLYLFLNSPGNAYFVREITRKIDEQINSVRRELSNMLEVGIITSNSADNKLYYEVNQRYEFYIPLRAIFGENIDKNILLQSNVSDLDNNLVSYSAMIKEVSGIRLAMFAGMLVKGSGSPVDVLLVGDIAKAKLKSIISHIEKQEGRDINYSVLSYDEFYYRLSVRDSFIIQLISAKNEIVVDVDNILSQK